MLISHDGQLVVRGNTFDGLYWHLVEFLRKKGVRVPNRTGIDTFRHPGFTLSLNVETEFPLLGLKATPSKSVFAELVGFLRGVSSAADFRALGTRIWDQNANENKAWLGNPERKGDDDLGRIYGVQWRHFMGKDDQQTDQLLPIIEAVVKRQDNRRLIVSAWQPAELRLMALPPCHLMFQVMLTNVDDDHGYLDLTWVQRSVDTFLGLPFNVASYASLMYLLCAASGGYYRPRTLTGTLGDTHLYENHLEMVDTLLSRDVDVNNFCTMSISHAPKRMAKEHDWQQIARVMDWIEKDLATDDFVVSGYNPQAAIKAPMAV